MKYSYNNDTSKEAQRKTRDVLRQVLKYCNCTSGWSQVVVIEEVRQQIITHFSRATAHGALLTVATHTHTHTIKTHTNKKVN